MKISIITTVYQAETDLPRLLDSMIAVKSQDIEFFLIDNGSTDNSNKICNEYAGKDPRFIVHRLEENIGYINARNLGLEIVDSDYVGFCDSDDYINPENYDIIINNIKENQSDFLIAGWYTSVGDNIKINESFVRDGIYNFEEIQKLIPQFFGSSKGKRSVAGFMWKEFIKKSIIDRIKLRFETDIKPYEDMLFNTCLIEHVASLQVINIPVYYYIVNPNSITSELTTRFNLKERYELQLRYWEKMNAIAKNDLCKEFLSNSSLLSFLSMASKAGRKYGLIRGGKEIKKIFNREEVKKQIEKSNPRDFNLKLGKILLKNRMFYLFLALRKLKG